MNNPRRSGLRNRGSPRRSPPQAVSPRSAARAAARTTQANWTRRRVTHPQEAAREEALRMTRIVIDDPEDGLWFYDDHIRSSDPNRAVAPTSPLRPYYTELHRLYVAARPRFVQLWTARRAQHVAQAEAAAEVNHAALTAAFLNRIRNRAVSKNWSNIKNADPISLKNARNWNGNHGIGIIQGNGTKYFTVNSFRRMFGSNWLDLLPHQNLGTRNPLTRQPIRRDQIVIVRFTGKKPT